MQIKFYRNSLVCKPRGKAFFLTKRGKRQMKRPFKKLTDEQLKIKLDGHLQGKENHPVKDGRESHANLEKLVREEISYREENK